MMCQEWGPRDLMMLGSWDPEGPDPGVSDSGVQILGSRSRGPDPGGQDMEQLSSMRSMRSSTGYPWDGPKGQECRYMVSRRSSGAPGPHVRSWSGSLRVWVPLGGPKIAIFGGSGDRASRGAEYWISRGLAKGPPAQIYTEWEIQEVGGGVQPRRGEIRGSRGLGSGVPKYQVSARSGSGPQILDIPWIGQRATSTDIWVPGDPGDQVWK